jgi:hypothetical protein
MLLLAIGCAVAAAVAAPAARADVLYVDPSGTNAMGHPCTSPGTGACQNILGVLVRARATNGGDTINIAPGTYTENVILSNAADDGDIFVGAGPGATTLLHGSAAGDFEGVQIGTPSIKPNFQMSNLTIEQDANAGALILWTTNGTLSNVAITLTNVGNGGTAVNIGGGDTTFNRLSVSGAWTGGGIAAPGIALKLNDSSITTGGLGVPLSMSPAPASSGSVDIQRSTLSASPTSTLWEMNTTNADVTIDSSLLTGGTSGLLAAANGQDHTALLRNDTIDTGNLGVTDANHNGVWASSAGLSDLMPITLDSSITLEQQKVAANTGASVACNSSDVPDQVATAIACGATGGNVASSPSDLFVDPTGGDYHLKTSPPSPAIDTGSTAALAVGESATDLEGNPRVVDSNFDCTARRDKGAYELPSPTASITGPDQAAFGEPAAFSGQISPSQPADPLTFAWTFTDGGSGSGQSVSHAFTAPGDQEATLTVMDPHGCSLTANHAITIGAKPSPPVPPALSHLVALRLGGSKKQRLGKFVSVKVTCQSDPCSASASGSLNVPGAAKRFKLKKATRSLAKGTSATLKLTISRKARRAALHALKRHKKVTARVNVAVTSSSANPASSSTTIRLRR